MFIIIFKNGGGGDDEEDVRGDISQLGAWLFSLKQPAHIGRTGWMDGPGFVAAAMVMVVGP